MDLNDKNVITQHLGHLGIVASSIERLGLMEKINRRLPLDQKKGGIVPHGQRVAAMLLNGLGFMGGRLYMTAAFFEDKPVSHLLGEGISASHLNDDCLGRCLDAIAAYGTTKLFSEVTYEVAREQGLLNRRLHLDSTSLTLYGDYPAHVTQESNSQPQPARGYSKAHRPDLKQVVLSLVEMGPANIPIWMEALDGNSSDKKSFQETVRRVTDFMQALKTAPNNLCFVVDAAFYVPEKLAELHDITWITRVPSTLNKSKKCLYQPRKKCRMETYIGALMMLMTLCLMVYNVAQYHLRQCLIENDETLPNQLGKPVKNPTMRWIFQLMTAISVVCIQGPDHTEKRIVTNVKNLHRKIILYFGPHACRIYGVPLDFKFQHTAANPKKLADWCEM